MTWFLESLRRPFDLPGCLLSPVWPPRSASLAPPLRPGVTARPRGRRLGRPAAVTRCPALTPGGCSSCVPQSHHHGGRGRPVRRPQRHPRAERVAGPALGGRNVARLRPLPGRRPVHRRAVPDVWAAAAALRPVAHARPRHAGDERRAGHVGRHPSQRRRRDQAAQRQKHVTDGGPEPPAGDRRGLRLHGEFSAIGRKDTALTGDVLLPFLKIWLNYCGKYHIVSR